MKVRVALLDENGKLPPEAFPSSVGGGGLQDVAFQFGGTLTVQSGAFYWLTPPAAIRIKRLSITLGILGDAGGAVTAALLVNGSAIGSVTSNGARTASVSSFTPAEIPAGQILSVDITAVPSSGATRPGNAVVQVLWEYV
mgnify:CR=1 FL=1